MTYKTTIANLVKTDSPHKDMVIDTVLSSVFDFAKPKGPIAGEMHSGAGTPKLFPHVTPIASIETIEVEDHDGTRSSIKDQVKLVTSSGMIVMRSGTFPRGYDNIRINYTAGYDPMPSELTGAIVAQVENICAQMKVGNITSEAIDDYRVTFSNHTPPHIEAVFSKYRKYYV